MEPQIAMVSVEWPEEPKWHFNLHFAVLDGIMECVGIDIRSFPNSKGPRAPTRLHAELLRRVPVGRLIREGAPDAKALLVSAAAGVLPVKRRPGERPHARKRRQAVLQSATRETLRSIQETKRRRDVTPDFLDEIARLYREARDLKLPVRPYIAGKVFRSPHTVSKHIRAARDAGKLDPSRQQAAKKTTKARTNRKPKGK